MVFGTWCFKNGTDPGTEAMDMSRQNFVIEQPGITLDPAQQQAVELLNGLYRDLLEIPTKPSLLGRLLGRRPTTVSGLYLWGGVGRGKTFLMDHFYTALPFAEKRRVHFHRFMQDIHAQLRALPKSPDPLSIIARRLAQEIRVLCLDEFHVNDIGDAMLLAGFLEALLEHGVTLVTTSNIPIAGLYKNGLQRERFLPAIALLQQYTREFELDGGEDYRSRLLERTGTYHLSHEEGAAERLNEQFTALVPDEVQWGGALMINKRMIDAHALSDDVVWFSFAAICETTRSSADYLVLAEDFRTIFVSEVPAMDEGMDDVAQRFIHLVDALYDHKVGMVISAAVPMQTLYRGRRHAFAFQRTISRLQEMGSEHYLGSAHRV